MWTENTGVDSFFNNVDRFVWQMLVNTIPLTLNNLPSKRPNVDNVDSFFDPVLIICNSFFLKHFSRELYKKSCPLAHT